MYSSLTYKKLITILHTSMWVYPCFVYLCLPVHCSQSKQPYLQIVNNPHTLKDGTSSFKDFSNDRNNRFSSQEQASKNSILHHDAHLPVTAALYKACYGFQAYF